MSNKQKNNKIIKIIVGIIFLLSIIGIGIMINKKQTDISKSFNTPYTSPYLPKGFNYALGTDLNTGLIIEDENGNQYVWIEVPKTIEVYPTSGLEITKFTDEEYANIEKDLHTYTSAYRNGTLYIDEYPEDIVEDATGLTQKEYINLKQKMLKSIYQNGGFYIGRYETGTTNSNIDPLNATSEPPVIKENVYPYGELLLSEAQDKASKMVSGKHTSSLLFGVQWDLVLKYLETKGTSQEELITNSTSWGNHLNSSYNITNTNSKYYNFALSVDVNYEDGPYGEKAENTKIFLSTGSSDEFMKQNIYDLAGNAWEWTLEYSSDLTKPCTIRGGSYGHRGDTDSASYRMNCDTSMYFFSFGFRVAIF